MVKTWLNTIGGWHQKFSDWSEDTTIATWKMVLRRILFIIVDTALIFVAFWGFMVLLLVIFSKFITGDTEEILED